MIRAVVDLNVIISATISPLGIPHQIWSAWLSDERFTLVISEGMIVELAGKLATPRIARRYGISAEDIQFVTTLVRTSGSLVNVTDERSSRSLVIRRTTLCLQQPVSGERSTWSRATANFLTSPSMKKSPS